MDRRVVDALHAMPECDRFVRGLVSWAGFRQIAVPYHRAPRFAGETKYPLSKMLRFALDGILSFSAVPLRAVTSVGLAVSVLALIGLVYAIALRTFTDDQVTTETAIVIGLIFFGGVQLVSVGIVGEYVGRAYEQAKRRPLYFIRDRLGFDRPAATNSLAERRDVQARRDADSVARLSLMDRRERTAP
jgi:dolichol-phosphate mannosyltransferase